MHCKETSEQGVFISAEGLAFLRLLDYLGGGWEEVCQESRPLADLFSTHIIQGLGVKRS